MYLALCDDDKQALSTLSKLIDEYKAQHCHGLAYEVFSDPLLLLERMRSKHFDLLILDVVMPVKSGLDLAGEVRSWNRQIPIIFLTSSSEFAVASYRVQAQDYLLKPVDKCDFFISLDRQIQQLLQQDSRISLQTPRGLLQLPISSIVYIEALNRKLLFIQNDGTITESIGTLRDMEQALLQHSQFTHPHRSYLVNLNYVEVLDKEGIYTTTGAFIPVSRGNLAKLKDQYMNILLADN